MNEHAAQRRAAWETLAGLVIVLSATQVTGDSLIETIAASALFTAGIAAFVHAGAMIFKGLRRTKRPPGRPSGRY
jgi:hypothetical protein